ncbi:MAG TPA: 6-hydroxymethylpterin diphosphokinase MptE-like protein [Nitrospinota bacterium]|jgi:hypothetical protein|nr:6-hydroxymethylpterin diphosphokinase MptE-like protein [Nitrospinota bacterium]
MVVINERIKEVKSATSQRFHAVWQNNFNANGQAISKNQGIRPLKGKFKDIPVILIGAGPSLDRNIEFLHIAADKSVLIASDASLQPLLKEGISSSFVVCLDPQAEISKFFQGINTQPFNLIAPTIIHPKVLSIWEGRVIFYNKFAPDIPVLTKIQELAKQILPLTPGGTVLSIAYDFAFQIGGNPIIFTGQDLSFPEGRGYTSSTIYEDIEQEEILLRENKHIVLEEDIFNKNIPTNKIMSVSRQWFEWAFTTWNRPNPAAIINSSEAGILKNHCKILPLKESVYRHCRKKINVNWQLQKLLKYKH